jgi:hypothetical protein
MKAWTLTQENKIERDCLRNTNLSHELLEHVLLLLLVAGWLAQLLLPLVEHHLLNHTPGLSIQITQLAILRLDLRDVYLRRRGDDVGPPLHLVRLVQVQLEDLGTGRGGGERPRRLINSDLVGEFALPFAIY